MATDASMLEELLDSADVAIYLKDEEGRIMMIIRCGAELLNKSKEEVIGKTDYDNVPKEDAEKVRDADQKVRETHSLVTLRDTFSFPSGRVALVDHKFPVEIEGHPHAVGGIAMRENV